MDRDHRDHAAAWDVVANATSLYRRTAGKRHIRHKQTASGSGVEQGPRHPAPLILRPRVKAWTRGSAWTDIIVPLLQEREPSGLRILHQVREPQRAAVGYPR